MSIAKEFVLEFDEKSALWSKSYAENRMLVRLMLRYVNESFKGKGYWFVRDIYERLGLPPTKESIIAGYHRSGAQADFNVIGDSKRNTIQVIVIAEEDIRDYF